MQIENKTITTLELNHIDFPKSVTVMFISNKKVYKFTAYPYPNKNFLKCLL